MNVLVDTSIWIAFFNNPESANAEKLAQLILEDSICICPAIHQEILQGTKDQASFETLNEKLISLRQLTRDPYLAATGAAKLYSDLRKVGVIIRKSNDCLIAWFALQYDLPIWHQDRDFDLIASQAGLKIFQIST